MAKDQNDNITQELFDNEEKRILNVALKTYHTTVQRKTSSDMPPQVQEYWHAEIAKIEALARKVAK